MERRSDIEVRIITIENEFKQKRKDKAPNAKEEEKKDPAGLPKPEVRDDAGDHKLYEIAMK